MSAARRTATHVAVGAILSLALAAPAQAQFWPPITEKLKQGRFRVGPLALTPGLELDAGVDTNVFLAQTEPTRDTSVDLRAALDAYCPVGSRVRLVGSGWLDYNYFKRVASARSTDPGGQGHLEFDLWRLTPFVGVGGLRSRQLYTTDIDERIERTEEWLNAGSRLRLTNQLSIEFGLESRKFRWGESAMSGSQIADELDRDSTTSKGGARLRLSSLTDLVASAERQEDTFLVAPPGLATTISYRYLAGFELAERAFMTGRILAGVREIPAGSEGSVSTYRGLVVQSSLVVPFLQRLRLTARYDRDLYYSASGVTAADAVLRNTYTYDRFQGDLDLEGPLDLVLRLSGGYEAAHYLRPVTTPDGPIDRRDDVYTIGASLLWRIGDSALLGVAALRTRRQSNDPAEEYERWRYGIQGFFSP